MKNQKKELVKQYLERYGIFNYQTKSLNAWKKNHKLQEIVVENRYSETSYYLRHDLLIIKDGKIKKFPVRKSEIIISSISFFKKIKDSVRNYQYYKTKHQDIIIIQYLQKATEKEITVFI